MKAFGRVFITGATGCAGRHLSRLLLAQGCRVFGCADQGVFEPGVDGCHCDIGDRQRLDDRLRACEPDGIFHLASLIPGRGDHPWEELLRVNVHGTHHLFDAALQAYPQTRVVVAGSSSIYGQPSGMASPLAEEAPLLPCSDYALSKAAQDLMAAQFFREHGLPVLRCRTFNQTGPLEPQGLVCASLARQVARIEAAIQEPVLHIGSLEAQRDFCDVRDVVAGYWAVMEHGRAGEAYNICSGRMHSIGDVLRMFLELAGLDDVRILEAPRAGRIQHQVGDFSRLQGCSGWAPSIPFEQSLKDLLDEWRVRVRSDS